MTPTASNADRPEFGDDAGVEYAAYIEAELDDEHVARASFEQRGLSVVTTSAALVAALFGFVAFLTDRSDFQIPNNATIPLYAALVLFAVAAFCGLFVNKPAKFIAPADDLEDVIKDCWDNPPAIARRRVAMTRCVVIAQYKVRNRRKAKTLIAAILAEVTGVLALAVAVALILRDST